MVAASRHRADLALACARSGSYALGVLTWYGFGRFWLEPPREATDQVCGRVRVNQVTAAAPGDRLGKPVVYAD
jgi:prolipoprotein diacylglyceryltransferase